MSAPGVRRLHLGGSHEKAVAEKAAGPDYGWDVHPWGQGLFDDTPIGEKVRAALVMHQPKTFWRWIPDLIAVRGREVLLVDPKTDASNTEFFSIEIDAYMAHHAMRGLGLRIVYVWQDFTVNTPRGLNVVRWQLVPERGKNRGSGTPYALVRKDEQYPFHSVFGHRGRQPS